jgi:DNA polymerase
MSDARSQLAAHLAHWAEAYGSDLPLPEGAAAPRAPAAPAAAPAAAAPSTQTAKRTETQDAAARAEAAAETATEPPTAAPEADPQAPSDSPAKHVKKEACEDLLRALRDEVRACTKCKLHQGRQAAVFGEGDPNARVMFVGEAPGTKENQTGRPFVGPAGQLLDRIIQGAMGLRREDVFIANVNKCWPPNNRAPVADEVAACLPYLKRQVELVQPEVIVCLGRTAAQNLLGSTESTTAMRRRQHEYAGTPVVVTWHPAYLLREPSHKRETWDDIKKVNRLLGLPDVPAS